MKKSPQFMCVPCGTKRGEKPTKDPDLYGKCDVCKKNNHVLPHKNYR